MAESTNEQPLTRYDELIEIFEAACKPESEFRCGAEAEKFGVFQDGRPLPYAGAVAGQPGVVDVLRHLAARGWKEDRESDDGPLLALLRDGASITLEPGSQLELSGAPLTTIHETEAEFLAHLAEIAPISRQLGVTWLGVGFHPFARRSDYVFVPKQRYGVMREYLPTRGALALDMMLRTATVQANYDFCSEEDAIRKMRVALALGPVTTAMFANSPFYEGAAFGGKSFRARVWLDVDPDRSGLVPALWREGSGFRDYIEWALDVPMFMFKRGGKRVENTGQTFRAFWTDGYEGHRPTVGDFTTHLNTLFPEVRLKKTIEVRGADAQGLLLTPALAALYTGIFYDAKALSEVEALVQDFTLEETLAVRRHVPESALSSPFRGGTLRGLAEAVILAAEGGLSRRARLSPELRDERVYLAPLKALVDKGECPADALLRDLPTAPDAFRSEVMRRAAF